MDPALAQLEPLIGEWEVTVDHPDLGRHKGRQSFAELEGGGWVIQHAAGEATEFPNSVSLLGPADDGNGLAMHYFDSRGVRRMLAARLEDGVFELQRDEPDPFPQRFVGELSADGSRMDARWERGDDAGNFELDFGMTYERIA